MNIIVVLQWFAVCMLTPIISYNIRTENQFIPLSSVDDQSCLDSNVSKVWKFSKVIKIPGRTFLCSLVNSEIPSV